MNIFETEFAPVFSAGVRMTVARSSAGGLPRRAAPGRRLKDDLRSAFGEAERRVLGVAVGLAADSWYGRRRGIV